MITIHIIILFLFPIFVNFDWQILNLILLLFLLLTSKIDDAIAGAITNSMLLWEFALVQYCDHSFFSNIFIEALDSVLILAMPKVVRSLFIGIFHLPLSFWPRVTTRWSLDWVFQTFFPSSSSLMMHKWRRRKRRNAQM